MIKKRLREKRKMKEKNVSNESKLFLPNFLLGMATNNFCLEKLVRLFTLHK